jgi:hypothetical protein
MVLFLVMGLGLCLKGAAGQPPKHPASPDVLFIVIDDLNDWISLLDAKAPVKMPNLERLAQRGMLFTRAYCASPACNPSRRGLRKRQRLAPGDAGSQNHHAAVHGGGV